jgi:hypothetical protein
MFLEDYNCAIYAHCTEETLLHLFLDWLFAVECWQTLGLTIQHSDDPFEIISSFRLQLAVPFFMEIIISMCWAIWSLRNDAIFRNIQPTISHARQNFRIDFAHVILRTKSSYVPSISLWLDAYV